MCLLYSGKLSPGNILAYFAMKLQCQNLTNVIFATKFVTAEVLAFHAVAINYLAKCFIYTLKGALAKNFPDDNFLLYGNLNLNITRNVEFIICDGCDVVS